MRCSLGNNNIKTCEWKESSVNTEVPQRKQQERIPPPKNVPTIIAENKSLLLLVQQNICVITDLWRFASVQRWLSALNRWQMHNDRWRWLYQSSLLKYSRYSTVAAAAVKFFIQTLRLTSYSWGLPILFIVLSFTLTTWSTMTTPNTHTHTTHTHRGGEKKA